jgi:glycosyltransferase involved in cell wall biosynthesis
MHYGHDREIDAAVASLAPLFTPPNPRALPIEPFRLAITCSGVQDEDGPTVVIVKRAEHFKRLGIEVQIVSTGVSQTNSQTKLQRLAEVGIPFFLAPDGGARQKLDWLIAHFQHHPVHAIDWTTSLYDNIGKLGAVIGLAPVQAWENRSLEPYVGKFDLVFQGVDIKQEQITEFPGASKFYGGSVLMGEEIDAATPWTKAMLGVPDDAVVLGTFGRMEKLNTETYLDAMSRILKSEPKAWLVLAGRDGLDAVASMKRRFEADGVWNRVRYLGPRQADGPALIKSIDIYCDTYPWVGGQTLLDAMQGGRPIVAMLPAQDTNLDPTGISSITSVAWALISDIMELAEAGNAEHYAQIARRYINDPELRARDGAAAYAKAKRDYDAFDKSKRYALDMKAIAMRKLGLSGDQGFRTISVNS